VKYAGKGYSLETFHSELPIENLWLGLHRGCIFRRGLPILDELQEPSIIRVFRAVLTNNSVTERMLDSTEDKTALELCFEQGWLHATEVQEELTYIFTTPLHRWFIEYYLGSRIAEFTPTVGQDLPAFTIQVIRNFSRLNLSPGEQIGAPNSQRLPEAQYKDEFYRCCHEHTNGSLISFPESGGARARVELYIPGGKWGVELLCDGGGLENHSSRFVGKDAYAKMEFNDHIILDFRVEPPKQPHPS
jgi:hypothetical protein